jgi:microcystin-dependent protein
VLFSLIGTTYGGDGVTTFALPNLQGKTMIHNDSNFALGQSGGISENTLTEDQLPAHNHAVGNLAASHNLTGTVKVNEEDATTDDPIGRNFAVAQSSSGNIEIYNSTTNTHTMDANNVQINGTITLSGATANTGNGAPINNMSPYLAMNVIIALEGLDPLAI